MLDKPKVFAVAVAALVIGYVAAVTGVAIVLGAIDAAAGTTFGSSQIGFVVAGLLGLIGAWMAARRATARV